MRPEKVGRRDPSGVGLVIRAIPRVFDPGLHCLTPSASEFRAGLRSIRVDAYDHVSEEFARQNALIRPSATHSTCFARSGQALLPLRREKDLVAHAPPKNSPSRISQLWSPRSKQSGMRRSPRAHEICVQGGVCSCELFPRRVSIRVTRDASSACPASSCAMRSVS
jgi:hypothetical protein